MRGCLRCRFSFDRKAMQDLLFLFLIAVFALALAGLVAGCAALGERE